MPEIETPEAQPEEAVESPDSEVEATETEPEPAGEETTEEGETAAEPTGEQGEETQGEGTADDWLPDEQKKEFPLEVLAEFAEKRHYGFTAEDIAKNPGLAAVLKDKLNTDIHIRNLQEQLGGDETEGDELAALLAEDNLELADQGQQQQTQQTQQTQQAASPDPRAEHYQRIDSLVTQLDPKSTEELGRNVLASLGVNTDPAYIQQLQGQLNDPQTEPKARESIQEYLKSVNGASKLGGTLAKGALDLVLTALPNVLPDLIEQIYPGTQQRYARGVAAETWENLSSAQAKDGNQAYPKLPKFGSPEYKSMVVRVEKGMGLPPGGLGAMRFTDARGQVLSPERQLQATMRLVAKAASGQKVSPAIVSQALQTGARKATEQAQRRAQGRALGSGQPTSSRRGAPSGNEDIFGPGAEEYKRRGG